MDAAGMASALPSRCGHEARDQYQQARRRPRIELAPAVSRGLAKLRKELKRERKREWENVRFIDGWEQYKTLWDGIEFKRQLINMGDKKVEQCPAV